MKINFNTKKLLWTLVSIVLGALTASAIPAHPRAVNVAQSDGSQLTIKLVGDEFYHRTMTTDGYTLMQRSNGDYVYAVQSGPGLAASNMIAHNPQARTGAELQMLSTLKQGLYDQTAVAQGRKIHSNRDKMTKPNLKADYERFRGLVILINFNNKTFSYGNSFFDNMLNQENYQGYTNKNGQYVSCTGSARDYFYDNSMGQFSPHFDVVGPVTVNYSCTTPQGYNNCGDIFIAACNAADALIDFSDYDCDGDGIVDIIYFIVAGYTSNFGGNNSGYLWPHEYDMRAYTYNRYDGVTLGTYSCSGEIYGWEGYGYVDPDGIGTMVHEFSHALGLMDLYDTDYESNGSANHPDDWDVMAGAGYLDNSHTPAGYTIWERYRLGFTEDLNLIDQKRSGYVLEPVNTSNAGYWLATQNDNEYFIIDNRQQTGWDRFIPGHGMTIYRVEYDENQWWYNTINCNASHMYYEMLRAGNGSGATASDPFPGSRNVRAINNTTRPSLKTWGGILNEMGLANITETNGIITFDVVNGDGSAPAPQLSVNPSSLSMSAEVGQTVTQTFTLTGTNLTNNVSVSISGNNAFSVNPANVSVSDAANGKVITVTYTPTAAGTQTATVTCASNGASSVTVNVTGTATVPPTITVNPSSLSFTGTVGETYTKTFTVTGTNLSSYLTLTLNNANGVYSINPTRITANQAANGATVTVTYTPTEAGTNNASVTISGGGATSKTVTLNGTATPPPTITVNPSSLSLASAIGDICTKTFTVTGANLSSDMTLTLNDANGVYSINPTRITPSQAASGVTVTVTYAPITLGTQTATVTCASNGASSVTVNLTGTAILKGDVNDDGKIAPDDIAALINYLLGEEVNPFNWNNADVNSDDTITPADIAALINILLGID